MKINIKTICWLSVFIISTAVMAIDNPNVGNPIKPSNVPSQSGQTQRFITQPGVNAYGRSGNDIVSGNVGGFKYFRGVVPYGSSYYSNAYSSNSDTAAVSNFLRRSADPLVNDRNPGQTRPYYEPRRTVSSLRRPDGTSGLSGPRLIGQAQDNPYRFSAPTQQLQVNPVYRPITANEMELEKILAKQQQQRQEAMKKVELDEDTEPIKKSFFDISLKDEILELQQQDKLQDKQAETEKDSTEDNVDVDPLSQNPAERIAAQVLEELQNENTEKDSTDSSNDKADSEDTVPDYMNPKSDLVPELDLDKSTVEKGREILGKHETFESLADEKFDNYMLLAETHLKKGQFYKAADIYALANVWKPEDARGYMGQSFSLFFAGEYMSSAYYLSRAIELNPELALSKYNLTELAGNRDVFENSDLEVTAAQQQSGSPELAFLVSYVAYQEGRSEQAVRLINDAKEGMPDSIAIKRLKNIIDPDPILK